MKTNTLFHIMTIKSEKTPSTSTTSTLVQISTLVH